MSMRKRNALIIRKQIQLFQVEEKVKAIWSLSQKENFTIIFVFLCLIVPLNNESSNKITSF